MPLEDAFELGSSRPAAQGALAGTNDWVKATGVMTPPMSKVLDCICWRFDELDSYLDTILNKQTWPWSNPRG